MAHIYRDTLNNKGKVTGTVTLYRLDRPLYPTIHIIFIFALDACPYRFTVGIKKRSGFDIIALLHSPQELLWRQVITFVIVTVVIFHSTVARGRNRNSQARRK